MISIAIISPEKSLEPINQVIETHDFGCEFHKYIYRELSDIDTIYEDCKNSCDVIFFRGAWIPLYPEPHSKRSNSMRVYRIWAKKYPLDSFEFSHGAS